MAAGAREKRNFVMITTRMTFLKRSAGALLVLAAASTSTRAAPAAPEVPLDYYLPPKTIETDKAPGMKVQLIRDGDTKTYAVIFYSGDEAFSGLMRFAEEYHVTSGHFTAVGALRGATLGWFDPQKKMFRKIPINEQVEVASMVGNFALYEGKPALHTHMVVARRDGTTTGGHIIEANVSPTLEVFVTVDPTPLERAPNPETGLTVIAPESK
jgi:hypothetical protein